MKKETRTYLILACIIILIIATIMIIKANGHLDEETMKCIASKSKMIVSPTCSACAYQKQILGNYLNYFETISVAEHPEVWEEYNLEGVPTWLINNKTYSGVHSIEELKELTGC